MKIKHGKATVWYCDPTIDEADTQEKVATAEGNMISPGCGFFGFYKPEADNGPMRKCPSCGNVDTYRKLEEWARIEVIQQDEV